MARQHHLDYERYLETEQGRRAPGSLAVLLHRHAVERCAECRTEWELMAREQGAVLDRLAAVGPLPAAGDAVPAAVPPPDPSCLPAAGTHAASGVDETDRRKRAQRRKARRELGILVRASPGEREDVVRRAIRRFRSLALAELLIDESRARVRTDPREAESLASLVPLVLADAARDERPAAVTRLLLSAAAHRANAVRIRGDLRDAARRFRRIREEMARREVLEPGLIAEVASLEASVSLDRRRFEDAEAGLGLALLAARQAGDRELHLRIFLQGAFFQRRFGNPERTLRLHERAMDLLGSTPDPYLRLSALTGRLLALCDLERHAEAERVLHRHQEIFEEVDDAQTGATLSAIRGRIALGLARLEEATAAFAMARDAMLDADRFYDAALACLDLAETHLRRGDAASLKRLAARLLRLFDAHGVERETLAVLQLFTRAVEAERMTLAALRTLRRRLRGDHRWRQPAAP